MFGNEVIELTKQALWLVLILSAPAVLAAAAVGLLIAFVQAATQLQEQTFQYAAKFFVICLALIVGASMTGNSLLTFSNRIFGEFAGLVHKN